MKKRPYEKSVFRAFTMVMQFGINMLVPVCMMTAAGIYLDHKFGTSFWMIILFFVGAIAGAQNVYRMAKGIMNDPGAKSKKEQGISHEAFRNNKEDK